MEKRVTLEVVKYTGCVGVLNLGAECSCFRLVRKPSITLLLLSENLKS